MPTSSTGEATRYILMPTAVHLWWGITMIINNYTFSYYFNQCVLLVPWLSGVYWICTTSVVKCIFKREAQGNTLTAWVHLTTWKHLHTTSHVPSIKDIKDMLHCEGRKDSPNSSDFAKVDVLRQLHVHTCTHVFLRATLAALVLQHGHTHRGLCYFTHWWCLWTHMHQGTYVHVYICVKFTIKPPSVYDVRVC